MGIFTLRRRKKNIFTWKVIPRLKFFMNFLQGWKRNENFSEENNLRLQANSRKMQKREKLINIMTGEMAIRGH